MKAKRGFTLVEILIVVVILGILAAIVIPQFTEASTEARASRLVSDLQTVRSQIELYRIQHFGVAPLLGAAQAEVVADPAAVPPVVGVSASAAGADFVRQMTTVTDALGVLWVDGTSATGPFGPYLKKMPTNPFTATATFSAGAAVAGSEIGWFYNEASGDIFAHNDVNYDDEVDPETELVPQG
jgi:general secretion pathway protein G